MYPIMYPGAVACAVVDSCYSRRATSTRSPDGPFLNLLFSNMVRVARMTGRTVMRAFIFVIAMTAIASSFAVADARTTHHRHIASHHRHRATPHRRRSGPRVSAYSANLTSCGGTERWDVKDGSDTGAAHVDPRVVSGITIAELNQLPAQPIDADGRMQEEKVIYRVNGILRLFKHETDSDYHIVIADDATSPFSTGHSMVVEVPDPTCVAGAHRQFGSSAFLSQLQESRADFEAATQSLPRNKDLGARNIPISLTGVLFFDFMHGQTGHGLPHPSQDTDTRSKVVEIHPVLCSDVGGYREQKGKTAC